MHPAGFVPTAPTAVRQPTLSTCSSTTLRPASAAPVLPPRAVTFVPTPNLHSELSPAPCSTSHHSDNALGKPTGTIIVLFRSDLRLDDHPALSHAIEEAATVIPLYCFDPRHFGRTDYGFEKTGRYRAKFLLESVEDLRNSLQKKGSDLVVRMGKPEEVLPDLVKKTGAKEVFMHREVTYEEQQVEEAVEKTLQGIAGVKFMWANTLYHEDDLPFEVGNMPDVYSDFREKVEKDGTIRQPLSAPKEMGAISAGLKPGEIPTLAMLGIRDIPVGRAGVTGVSSVTGGESEAMQRVKAYVEDSRKLDVQNSPRACVTAHLGADFSCRISPWLALGCISPRRIFDEMKTSAVRPELLLKSSTYYELVWRDFFRCITAKYSSKRSKAIGNRARHPRSMARA